MTTRRPDGKPSSASPVRVKSGIRTTDSRPTSKTTLNGSPARGGSASKQRIHSKPSDRLNPKIADPFNKKIARSVFAAAYAKGGIPCRLSHGSVKHKIEWTTPPENLDFGPMLVMFAEGLKELDFPHNFVAHEGFVQLLQIQDAEERTLPVLPKLITPIKVALMVKDDVCFEATLQGLVELSNVVTSSLNEHLKNFLPQISRRLSSNRSQKEKITIVLQKIEMNGGSECTTIIKSRIPTYASVL